MYTFNKISVILKHHFLNICNPFSKTNSSLPPPYAN